MYHDTRGHDFYYTGFMMLDFAHWMVQGRVLLVQFSGVLTLEDIRQVNEQGLILLEAV